MEVLYTKLYDKYTKLKAKRDSEFEQLNYDQEEKFMTYMSAADKLIDFLNSEKDTLLEQITSLRQEVVSIRSAKDYEQGKYEKMQEKYEKMLMEEKQKNKELSEEIEKLHRKEFHSSDMLAIKQVSGSPLSSRGTSNSIIRKRPRNSTHENDVEVDLGVSGQKGHREHILQGESENALDKENMFAGAFNNANQLKCCRRRLDSPENASDSICVFQELVECLIDLKFSIATQTDGNIEITAVHESSGFSFNLGWVKNKEGEEELLYSMSSMGTLERVAPKWMRDVMVFRKVMCRRFFEKVSNIIRSQ